MLLRQHYGLSDDKVKSSAIFRLIMLNMKWSKLRWNVNALVIFLHLWLVVSLVYKYVWCLASTAPLRPIYSHVLPVFPTWHPYDGCGMLPHIVWMFCLFVYSWQAGVSISGATVWNDLLLHVASAPSFAVFRQRLEAVFFSRSYQDTIIWLMCYYYHSSLLSDISGPCSN